ncbi:hypothetical protein GALMADRAFT_147374 [Galerina marginata CBS 339.88]|uniref:Transmembrane protein n=1 Tax=Galerina marginata (strain CBS 339.88) TaxID=685588 RepID=A0A067SK77_GALM3|nr:hypothetical protein GALMADRAFT_147374 [Galerina marginata CBS 339.88]
MTFLSRRHIESLMISKLQAVNAAFFLLLQVTVFVGKTSFFQSRSSLGLPHGSSWVYHQHQHRRHTYLHLQVPAQADSRETNLNIDLLLKIAQSRLQALGVPPLFDSEMTFLGPDWVDGRAELFSSSSSAWRRHWISSDGIFVPVGVFRVPVAEVEVAIVVLIVGPTLIAVVDCILINTCSWKLCSFVVVRVIALGPNAYTVVITSILNSENWSFGSSYHCNALFIPSGSSSTISSKSNFKTLSTAASTIATSPLPALPCLAFVTLTTVPSPSSNVVDIHPTLTASIVVLDGRCLEQKKIRIRRIAMRHRQLRMQVLAYKYGIVFAGVVAASGLLVTQVILLI